MTKRKFKERRRAPRVAVRGRAECMLSPQIEATLLDLSLTGAGVEHSSFLRPSSRCELAIRGEQWKLRLKAKVIWTVATRSEKWPDGTTKVIYRTGMEFLDLTPKQQEQLTALVQALQTGGGASPPGGKDRSAHSSQAR